MIALEPLDEAYDRHQPKLHLRHLDPSLNNWDLSLIPRSDMLSSRTRTLRDLIAEKAIRPGPITLSNGGVSAYYFDCKRLTLSSDGAAAVGEAVAEAIETLPERPAAIGGLTLGADPIIGPAMMCVRQRGWALEGFYVRKTAKEHGTKQFIENEPERGSAVVIVDDVITTGRSVLDAIERTEAVGCRVIAVITIVDRLEGGTANIKNRLAAGAQYIPLFDLNDFPEIEDLKRACNPSAQLSTLGSI